MTNVLTTKLKNDTTRMFYQDIQDNNYYVFVSSVSSDPLTRISAVNSQYSKNLFLEKTLFGKKVFDTDTKFMIKYYPWQKDQLYVQYDDKINLEDKRFYAIVGPTNNNSGDYRVYKCLSNNNGSVSSIPPNYNPVTENQIYRVADGYVWKYLYVLTVTEFEAYNAIGYIPLVGDFEIDPSANSNNTVYGSEISDILVENYIDNTGYPYVEVGIIAGSPGNDSTLLVRSDELNEIANYYSGMIIYIYNSAAGRSYVYEIDTYEWDAAADRGRLKVIGNPKADGVVINSTFQILPRIKVSGDGAGAVAVPRINNGVIETILLIEQGSGYNNITAEVIDPIYDFNPEDVNTVDVRAVLRPVLSPVGGHNYNLIDEMHCRHILLYGYITETDNNQIGATNTYSVVGVVKNPEFLYANTDIIPSANTPDVFDNRISVVTDDYTKVVVNSLVVQRNLNNEVTFSAKVHEIDGAANTIYLSEYTGPYLNIGNNDTSLDPNQYLVNSTGQLIIINTPVANSIIESQYNQRTGTVYFMDDLFPLTRSTTSREEYKLVLEF